MSRNMSSRGLTLGKWALLTLICGIALALMLFASPARADTFNVPDINDSGAGSLRKAISLANANNERDTITFSFTGRTITLTGSDLIVEDDVSGADLTIDGPGADKLAVDGGGNDRVFLVGGDANTTIEGLTVTGGRVSNGGGGILNNGTLTLNNSIVSGNSTAGGTYFNEGGGIHNRGTLTLNSSTVSGNYGGFKGGGIYNFLGTLNVNNSTVSGNISSDGGGGIYSYTDDAPLTKPNPAERTTIRNSTISGNETSGHGGGVQNKHGLTIIENTTITKNTTPPLKSAGVASYGNGDNDTRTDVRASIISNNTATDVDHFRLSGTSTNTFRSLGSNIVGEGNATGEFNKSKDQSRVVDPKLGALADNGGHTKTHKLLSGSPALDAAATATFWHPGGGPCSVATDQRGESRPQDGDNNGSRLCDVGSFELKAAPLVVTPPDPPPPTNTDPRGCTIMGTPAADTIYGTSGNDIICGYGGADKIYGRDGNDKIYGDGSADTLYGQGGADILVGGSANDNLYGMSGNDRIFGQRVNDVLNGGGGADRLVDTNGRDRLYGGLSRDYLNVRDNKVLDLANGGTGRDTCRTDRRDTRRSCP